MTQMVTDVTDDRAQSSGYREKASGDLRHLLCLCGTPQLQDTRLLEACTRARDA